MVEPIIKNDVKTNAVLAAKGKAGEKEIADGRMAEESVTVDGGIKNLNQGVDDGREDITAENGIKVTHNGFLPPLLNQQQVLGRLRGHQPRTRRLIGQSRTRYREPQKKKWLWI